MSAGRFDALMIVCERAMLRRGEAVRQRRGVLPGVRDRGLGAVTRVGNRRDM